MKCFQCKEEFEKPQAGRNIFIFVFMIFISFWTYGIPAILYLIFTHDYKCPYCGKKVSITKFNKLK